MTANKMGKFDLCKKHNDKRGCDAKRCPQGKLHACDIVLTTDRVCGAKDHNRHGHDPKKHGAFKTR